MKVNSINSTYQGLIRNCGEQKKQKNNRIDSNNNTFSNNNLNSNKNNINFQGGWVRNMFLSLATAATALLNACSSEAPKTANRLRAPMLTESAEVLIDSAARKLPNGKTYYGAGHNPNFVRSNVYIDTDNDMVYSRTYMLFDERDPNGEARALILEKRKDLWEDFRKNHAKLVPSDNSVTGSSIKSSDASYLKKKKENNGVLFLKLGILVFLNLTNQFLQDAVAARLLL